jgi:hypothetical protein
MRNRCGGPSHQCGDDNAEALLRLSDGEMPCGFASGVWVRVVRRVFRGGRLRHPGSGLRRGALGTSRRYTHNF